MKVSLDIKNLEKTLLNIADYSIGFIDGVQSGKQNFLNNFANGVVDVLKMYIDSEARSNPASLHHVYEWYRVGSPTARLFEFTHTVNRNGFKINSTFKQSDSISKNSVEPFYQKASIMEQGKTLKIKPKNAEALAFVSNGEMVFSKKEIVVTNPGGPDVEGSFADVVDEFFNFYFTQSFLRSSGLADYLKSPQDYKTNFNGGAKRGRLAGYEVGFKWISNAKVGVVNG